MAEKLPCPTPSWSDIPTELAGLVLCLLPAYADRVRFTSVCPQWRAAARQLRAMPPPPLLALPDGTFYSLPSSEPFRFPGCGFAGYESACGSWLVFPRDDGCFLVDPFSSATVTLPALSSIRLRPPNAELNHIPVRLLIFTWLHVKDKNPHLSKLMMCSPNLAAAFVNVHGLGQIIVCQPGASSWSVRAYDTCQGFEDMAFYEGKLYTLSHHEQLSVVNISQDQTTGDPHVSRIRQVIKGDPDPFNFWPGNNTTDDKKLYPLESRGALLMVRRKICCRRVLDKIVAGENEFEVFQADFKRSRWVNVITLGDDQVIFLGRRSSRALSVSQFGMPGNRIFFLDEEDEYFNRFCYEENTFVSVYDMIRQEVSSPLSTISWKRDGMRLATWLLPRD